MNSLSSTAEEILELCGRDAAHTDPKIARVMLLTDIENAIHTSEFGQGFHKQIYYMDCEMRQKDNQIDDLEDRVEELESDLEESERKVTLMEPDV